MLNKTKFEKVLARVINKNDARCSMCKRPFTVPSHTFGGLDINDKVQNVGRCCADSLRSVRHGGVFTTVPFNTEEGQQQAKALIASHPARKHMQQ